MSKKIILLVDDDPALSQVLKERIEEAGYYCVCEKDGAAGLTTMRNVTPDLLLLDIMMPIMNGYEVLEAISVDPQLQLIPVMVISNSGEPVEISRILGLGVKDYIVKAHFSPQEVVEKVQALIGGPESSSTDQKSMKRKPPEQTNILLIEDDATLSDIASDRFRHAGYHVFTANNGEEGLRLANEIHPDLILLDVLMPGMNGFDVLKTLKSRPEVSATPVAIFSNLAQETDIALGQSLGAVDFLVKANFTPAQLVERIEQILENTSTA